MTFRQKIRLAKKIIKENLEKYPNSVLACSFGKDSMVLLHLMRPLTIPVISVLSDTEFKQTLELRDKIVKRWIQNYQEFTFSNEGVLKEQCCRDKKVDIFKSELEPYNAWFSAIRRDEGLTRIDFDYVEDRGGLIKINPLLDWTELDIWRYTALYRVPVNKIYRKGYRSLSCSKCSSKEKFEGESERAGRWKGTNFCGGECGIHQTNLRV